MTATDTFGEVKGAVTLSSYVESTFGSTLKSRGPGRFSTACPVHGGDNESAFSIDDNQGLWYCFSQCGRGGDIFDLWQATNNSSSRSAALQAIASYAGVTLPERERHISPASLTKVLNDAADLFADALMSKRSRLGDAPGADEAYRWLRDDRGMTTHTMDLAQVGFVPDLRDSSIIDMLVEHLGGLRSLRAAGLVHEVSDSKRLYCPFAGRIVFPIRDRNGDVTGFGARVVPGVTYRQEPKFVNTRQTELYNKSEALFGIEHIRRRTERVFVCEGYLDAVAINALDRPEWVAVAACGTAVTPEHIDLLLDSIGPDATVTFMMDADGAGLKSMARLTWAAEALRERGQGLLLSASSGKDPWEAYVGGTLESDIDASTPLPLLDAALRAKREVAETDEAFDALVTQDIQAARGADFADDVLRSAAKLRSVPIADYGQQIKRSELAEVRRRAPRKSALLSTPTQHLISALLASPAGSIRGVAAALAPWDGHTEGFVERWLPTDGPFDVKAIGYTLFASDETSERPVVEAVSACLGTGDDEEVPSISPLLEALARKVMAFGARVAHEAPPALVAQLKACRTITRLGVAPEDELEALVQLIDVAGELERLD